MTVHGWKDAVASNGAHLVLLLLVGYDLHQCLCDVRVSLLRRLEENKQKNDCDPAFIHVCPPPQIKTSDHSGRSWSTATPNVPQAFHCGIVGDLNMQDGWKSLLPLWGQTLKPSGSGNTRTIQVEMCDFHPLVLILLSPYG